MRFSKRAIQPQSIHWKVSSHLEKSLPVSKKLLTNFNRNVFLTSTGIYQRLTGFQSDPPEQCTTTWIKFPWERVALQLSARRCKISRRRCEYIDANKRKERN